MLLLVIADVKERRAAHHRQRREFVHEIRDKALMISKRFVVILLLCMQHVVGSRVAHVVDLVGVLFVRIGVECAIRRRLERLLTSKFVSSKQHAVVVLLDCDVERMQPTAVHASEIAAVCSDAAARVDDEEHRDRRNWRNLA